MAPYAAFTVLVIIYNYIFLGQGFNATDEGYLLSLGQRIAHGDVPFRDFYFLRTPLSIYIQGGLIALFGDHYTVLASRIYWAIEMWGLAVILSAVYRRYVGRLETFLLLCTTYVASTQLLSFPWYSYDAAFFASVAVVLLARKSYLLAGVAAFAAAMAKQNYALLLPLFLALSLLVQWKWPKLKILDAKTVLLLAVGLIAPSVLYLLYLVWQGNLGSFIQNVLVLPQQASQVPLHYTLLQNNVEAAITSLPLIAAVCLLYYSRRKSVLFAGLAGLLAVGAIVIALLNYKTFVYSLVYLNYTLLVLTFIELVRARKGVARSPIPELLPAVVAAVVIQYLAGFNYTGVGFGYMTCGVGLVIGYLLFRERRSAGNRPLMATGLLLGVLVLGLFYKYDIVYRDTSRTELTTEFHTPKLRGITSTPRNVQQVDGLVEAVKQYAKTDTNIFIFPDFPILYYLTDKRNPTPIEWYTILELGDQMIPGALLSLERHKPTCVFVQTYPEGDFKRSGNPIVYRTFPRYGPFMDYILKRYKMLKQVGDVVIFTRNDHTTPTG